MKIVLTGASGYIGTRFSSFAGLRGHTVVAMGRKFVSHCSAWIPFDLQSAAPIFLPEGTEFLVHMASENSETNGETAENEIRSAKKLLAVARQSGVKFLFLSSQTAREDAPTLYGRTKWKIEQEVLLSGGWIVRPGQVFGGKEHGMFGRLVGLVRRWPFLPAFVPCPKIQPIHVDDLVFELFRIIENTEGFPPLSLLGSPCPVTFTQFLKGIATGRIRRYRWFIPVPSFFVRVFLFFIGKRLRGLLGLESLMSLFSLPYMDTLSTFRHSNISLRSLSAGMHPSGDDRKRRLLMEARTLFVYVLRNRPNGSLLRRYVRVVSELRGGRPLGIPRWACQFPAALAVFESPIFLNAQGGTEFLWRLNAATVLMEATVLGVSRFIGNRDKNHLAFSFFGIGFAILGEMFWRAMSWIVAPILRYLLFFRWKF